MATLPVNKDSTEKALESYMAEILEALPKH